MTVDRNLWRSAYEVDDFPAFACPTCRAGRLRANEDPVIKEPTYSIAGREGDAYWEVGFEVERFWLSLICDNAKCGEVATVSGDSNWDEQYDEEEGGTISRQLLKPRAFFPAPWLIDMPDNVPPEVVESIMLASAHFWSDKGASANRLRAGTEYLLDHLKVPREDQGRADKTIYLDLNRRIKLFEQTNADHAPSFNALRIIGNLGSHGAEVTPALLMAAFELFEYTLEQLCGKKERIEELRQRIIDSRGRHA